MSVRDGIFTFAWINKRKPNSFYVNWIVQHESLAYWLAGCDFNWFIALCGQTCSFSNQTKTKTNRLNDRIYIYENEWQKKRQLNRTHEVAQIKRKNIPNGREEEKKHSTICHKDMRCGGHSHALAPHLNL